VFGLTARIIRNHAALDAPENRGVAGSIRALAIPPTRKWMQLTMTSR
jgi:hypothetical protein